MRSPASRLIDLRIDWFRQYAPETKVAGLPTEDVRPRLSQVDGYFSHTAVAFVSCGTSAELLPRIEAEFSGRVLYGPADVGRFRDDASGLTWAVIGHDSAVQEYLQALFHRGVRLFSPFRGENSAPTDAEREFLGRMEVFSGPRPILDLAGANPEVVGHVLEACEAREGRMLLMDRGMSLRPDHLARFRALGGLIGVPIASPRWQSADEIRGAIMAMSEVPYRGRAGYEGIAIATGFLESDRTPSGLGNAGDVVAWLERAFDPPTARMLLAENALKIIGAMAGESV